MSENKTIVIGLDGGNWELLDKLVKKHDDLDLPNISQLKKEGAWGDMKSCLPPVTFPNWKCYSTGKNPGKLDVYWFEKVDKKKQTINIINSRAFHAEEIWDYLGENGYSCGVINMPTTFPPKKINGFMICGGPNTRVKEYRRIPSGYTYPRQLEKELQKRGYNVHPKNIPTSKDDTGKEIDEILQLLRDRFTLAKAKLEEVEFLHVTLFYLNVLQHFFWTGEPTKRAWKIIDKQIGDLMEKDVNIILMSDHGCAKIHTVFNINTWLEATGFLRIKYTIEDLLNKIGINRENLLSIAKKFGMVEVLDKLTPQSMQKMVPRSSGVKKERKADKIHWLKSKAFAGNQGPVYWLDALDQRKELIQELENLRSPEGKKIARNVYTCEQAYGKNPDRHSPDIIIDQKKGVHIRAAIGPKTSFSTEDKWKAENKRTGLFLAYGEDIQPTRMDTTSILDITPTILHLYNLPIPKDLDGHVQKEIFGDESDPAMREVAYVSADYY